MGDDSLLFSTSFCLSDDCAHYPALGLDKELLQDAVWLFARGKTPAITPDYDPPHGRRVNVRGQDCRAKYSILDAGFRHRRIKLDTRNPP